LPRIARIYTKDINYYDYTEISWVWFFYSWKFA